MGFLQPPPPQIEVLSIKFVTQKKFESAQLNELLPFINQKDAMNINWLKKKAVNERELRRKFLFFCSFAWKRNETIVNGKR